MIQLVLPGADLEIYLGGINETDSREGFTEDEQNSAPHNRALAWYAGTADVSLREFESPNTEESVEQLYRRLGDLDASSSNLQRPETWYSPNNFEHGAENAPWEGIGTGWFYSVLGGGQKLRPDVEDEQTSVWEDNTAQPRQRGDFAVPTLFNGNFDAINEKSDEQPIPSWSSHGENGSTNLTQDSLINRQTDPDFSDVYTPGTETNYALKLNPGESITHNRFVVPDWGTLRFDLYVPDAASNPLVPSSSVQAIIKEANSTDTGQLLQPVFTYQAIDPSDTTTRPNAVGYYDYVDGTYVDPYTYQIGYGVRGFETFHLDIPEELRGKVVELEFRLLGGSSVYIDDVFFKSKHLQLGNPTYARPYENTHRENYLIEKPQYTVSYNDSTKTPNWVSWRHDKSWLGDVARPERPPATSTPYVQRFPAGFDNNFPNYLNDQVNPVDSTYSPRSDRESNSLRTENYPWLPDISLPFNWVKTQGPDYGINNSIPRRRMDRGHLVASSERNRTPKDNFATFLTTNVIPQNPRVNQIGRAWFNLETAIKNAVTSTNNPTEFYIIAGGASYDLNRVEPTNYPSNHPFYLHPNPIPGVIRNFVQRELNSDTGELVSQKDNEGRILTGYTNPSTSEWIVNPKKIGIPEFTWKIIVSLLPGQGIADITQDTKITAVLIPNVDPSQLHNNQFTLPIPDGRTLNISNPDDWRQYIVSVDELEQLINYNFFSEVSEPIRNQIKQYLNSAGALSASLLANNTEEFYSIDNSWLDLLSVPISDKSTIGENHIPVSSTHIFEVKPNSSSEIDILHEEFAFSSSQVGVSQVRGFYPDITQIGVSQTSPFHITVPNRTIEHSNSIQVGSSKIGIQNSLNEGVLKIGVDKNSVVDISPFHVGTTQNSSTQVSSFEIGKPQIDSTKIDPTKINSTKIDSIKISFANSIPSEQFFSIHNSTPEITNRFNNSATNIWSDLLQPSTQLDINFQITDLPKGQLAEATITGFDPSGKPNAGTILIDRDANGVGWFIDETPLDNSEFINQNSASYFLADPKSEANGKYDLLTTVLHELAHLYGFIEGYAEFDNNLQTQNNNTKFIGENFTATIDGEHLDKQAHPNDLLNTHLAPGIRKLPSQLDVEILKTILAFESEKIEKISETLDALLTSDPLLGILNGDFSITDNSNNNLGWQNRGASIIANGQAVLTEDSPFLSNFIQTFTIPEDANNLQFTLVEVGLSSENAPSAPSAPPAFPTPSDSFEVALLDPVTLTPLVNTDIGLSETDALLNIQNDGTTYFSNNVRIGSVNTGKILDYSQSRTFTIDISHLAAGTEATLYFDLLGFGAVDSRVVIDDVKLTEQVFLAPIATDDRATTDQGQSVTIDILSNDRDDDGNIETNSVQIQTQPNNGTAIPDSDGNVSYIPGIGFAGTDSFTYVVQDNDGEFSNPATVTVTVDNVAPTIDGIQLPDNITEGIDTTITAIVNDPGNDLLDYIWDFSDLSSVINDPLTVNRTFIDEGNYSVTITVTDPYGGSNTRTFNIPVNNALPVVNAGSDQTINEGESINFNGNFSDSGISDTHTFAWDLGDSSTATTDTLTPTHTYIDDGTYTAILTVTDNDGGVGSDTVTITVNNVAPTITNLTVDKNILDEGETANFSASATDPGDDTLTYT